jgi:hypothetical protein
MYKIGDRLTYKSHSLEERLKYFYVVSNILVNPEGVLITLVIEGYTQIPSNTYFEDVVERYFELVAAVRQKRTCKLPEWF